MQTYHPVMHPGKKTPPPNQDETKAPISKEKLTLWNDADEFRVSTTSFQFCPLIYNKWKVFFFIPSWCFVSQTTQNVLEKYNILYCKTFRKHYKRLHPFFLNKRKCCFVFCFLFLKWCFLHQSPVSKLTIKNVQVYFSNTELQTNIILLCISCSNKT